jgi:3-hydroxybutyryl-CoA dehydrogenase
MNLNLIAVLGGGQMGSGIAQVFAQSGFKTVIYDLAASALDKSKAGITKNLDRAVEKGKLTADEREAVLGRLTWTSNLADLAETDLVVEAIIEKLETKLQTWKQLDELCRPTTIFASNTSSLPITQLAGGVSHPERFIGMHFMNPVPVMQLVEIIRGYMTSDAVYQTIFDLSKTLGKVPVTVEDSPGFISNRILMPMINEAIFCLYEGIATKEDIDTVMKLGMNHPMGPLTLADFIGLDTCLFIMEVLYRDFADSKYRPCPLLRKMVQAGQLGRKTGAGFYTYDTAPKAVAAK